VLKPEMAARMGRHFDNLTQKEVVAGHWALWEAAGEVNDVLRDWFAEQVFGTTASL
jgi:soluble epoxide hydrolase/lipid-phosphate phosphatase